MTVDEIVEGRRGTIWRYRGTLTKAEACEFVRCRAEFFIDSHKVDTPQAAVAWAIHDLPGYTSEVAR